VAEAASLRSRFCNSLALQNRARQQAVRMHFYHRLIGDWFIRYPLALIGVAMVAVIGWLVICSSAGFLPD
jgi:bacteriorhodopsin